MVALLEKIQATPEVIDACETLKGLGYTLALDDFVSTRGFEPLLDLAEAAGDDSSDKTRLTWAEDAFTMPSVLSGGVHNAGPILQPLPMS